SAGHRIGDGGGVVGGVDDDDLLGVADQPDVVLVYGWAGRVTVPGGHEAGDRRHGPTPARPGRWRRGRSASRRRRGPGSRGPRTRRSGPRWASGSAAPAGGRSGP